MAKPGTRGNGALRRALELLKKVPMVDGHNDLPWVIRRDPLAQGDVLKYDLSRRHNDGDTDIPRLRQGRVGGQIWAAYVPTDIEHPARSVLEQIDIILRINAAHPNVFLPSTRAADIGRAKRLGKIASIMAVEGGVGLENSLSPLRVWHAAGARLMTLCHNGTLDWVDSATDATRHGGLTAFGRAVVGELNRLGMIVDCAHVSPDVMRQVLDVSTAPIVFSHSNARGLCDHPRNVPDDVLDKLASKDDGLVMATFIPDFISEEVRQWMEPIRIALANDPVTNRLEMIAAHERTHGPRPQATLPGRWGRNASVSARISSAFRPRQWGSRMSAASRICWRSCSAAAGPIPPSRASLAAISFACSVRWNARASGCGRVESRRWHVSRILPRGKLRGVGSRGVFGRADVGVNRSMVVTDVRCTEPRPEL
jgi:membrane dipeptidase